MMIYVYDAAGWQCASKKQPFDTSPGKATKTKKTTPVLSQKEGEKEKCKGG